MTIWKEWSGGASLAATLAKARDTANERFGGEVHPSSCKVSVQLQQGCFQSIRGLMTNGMKQSNTQRGISGLRGPIGKGGGDNFGAVLCRFFLYQGDLTFSWLVDALP